jgi:hypothetical protein
MLTERKIQVYNYGLHHKFSNVKFCWEDGSEITFASYIVKCLYTLLSRSRDISVCIVKFYRLNDQASISGRIGDYSVLHSVQIVSGFHPVSYPMGTEGSDPRDKAAGAQI